MSDARKLLIVTICADATNSYDRVAHPFTSLGAQYFRLEISCLAVLFRKIQSMKMLLRTSYGVSDSHYSGDEDKLCQGVVQSSGAALALWIIISIFLIRHLCSKNLHYQIVTPFTKIIMPLVALLFTDDTNLCVINSGSKFAEEVVTRAQKLLDV